MRYYVYTVPSNLFTKGYDSFSEIHHSRHNRESYLIIKANELKNASKIADSILGSNY